jgi:hypothetical protein
MDVLTLGEVGMDGFLLGMRRREREGGKPRGLGRAGMSH